MEWEMSSRNPINIVATTNNHRIESKRWAMLDADVCVCQRMRLSVQVSQHKTIQTPCAKYT